MLIGSPNLKNSQFSKMATKQLEWDLHH